MLILTNERSLDRVKNEANLHASKTVDIRRNPSASSKTENISVTSQSDVCHTRRLVTAPAAAAAERRDAPPRSSPRG